MTCVCFSTLHFTICHTIFQLLAGKITLSFDTRKKTVYNGFNMQFEEIEGRAEMKVLIVVDMQIVPAVVEKAADYEGKVIFTKDTHGEDYLSTREGKYLPVEHCIKGTPGWKLLPELEKICSERQCTVYEKDTFGSVKLMEDLLQRQTAGEIEEIELIGLCTDICVVSNALLLKAAMPETDIKVDASCCAGVTKESHEAALCTMKSCQIQILGN